MSATAAEVRAITGSTLDDAAIAPFLAAADCILDRVSACTTRKGVTPGCLDIAAAWLAAHLLTLSSVGQESGVKRRETFENYTVEYVVGSYGSAGIKATSYGNTANELAGGCLQEADKAPAQVCFFG